MFEILFIIQSCVMLLLLSFVYHNVPLETYVLLLTFYITSFYLVKIKYPRSKIPEENRLGRATKGKTYLLWITSKKIIKAEFKEAAA